MKRHVFYGALALVALAVAGSAQQLASPNEWLTWGYDQQRT